MRKVLLIVLFAIPIGLSAAMADAHGCIKGAAVGAVAGRVAGHHAIAGAAVGCVVGHHRAKVNEREAAQPRALSQDGSVKPSGGAPAH